MLLELSFLLQETDSSDEVVADPVIVVVVDGGVVVVDDVGMTPKNTDQLQVYTLRNTYMYTRTCT